MNFDGLLVHDSRLDSTHFYTLAERARIRRGPMFPDEKPSFYVLQAQEDGGCAEISIGDVEVSFRRTPEYGRHTCSLLGMGILEGDDIHYQVFLRRINHQGMSGQGRACKCTQWL
jgi:hypothetical protein